MQSSETHKNLSMYLYNARVNYFLLNIALQCHTTPFILGTLEIEITIKHTIHMPVLCACSLLLHEILIEVTFLLAKNILALEFNKQDISCKSLHTHQV